MEDSVEVELRPRFPLFGGWKTHYLLGYNVPSYEYLFSKGDNFVLNMRLLDHVFDDMLVEDFTLRIILPEGSQVIILHIIVRKNSQKNFDRKFINYNMKLVGW